jgi:uncharacterized DUF497 family protein
MASFDIYYKYRFEWDPDKAASNLKKHGISFKEAATVFYDPDRILEPDHGHSTSMEIRNRVIGISDEERCLLVIYTERDPERTRIISSRRANRRERKAYET